VKAPSGSDSEEGGAKESGVRKTSRVWKDGATQKKRKKRPLEIRNGKTKEMLGKYWQSAGTVGGNA